MKISYTFHAKEQLKERNIKKELIEETLLNPSQILLAEKGRKIAQKLYFEGRIKFLLRVIYVVEKGNFVVLSCYKTTRIEKYWVKK